MKPRSAAWKVRMTAPRSMTLPMRSRPSENLMVSTAVSICGEGAENLLGADAGSEGGVALGVEGFGLGHASGHPDDDYGIGGSGGGSGADHAGFAAGERGEGGGGGGAHEAAAGDAGGDELLFARVSYGHVSRSTEIPVS